MEELLLLSSFFLLLFSFSLLYTSVVLSYVHCIFTNRTLELECVNLARCWPMIGRQKGIYTLKKHTE